MGNLVTQDMLLGTVMLKALCETTWIHSRFWGVLSLFLSL